MINDPTTLQAAATGVDNALYIQVDGTPVPAVHACVFGANAVSQSVQVFMEAFRTRLATQAANLRLAADAYTDTDEHGATEIGGVTWA